MILEPQIPNGQACNVNPATNFTVLVCGQQPSKHEAFTQRCFNVGPTSSTLAQRLQRWPNIETTLIECPVFDGKAGSISAG